MRFWMMMQDDYPRIEVPVGETIVRSVNWGYSDQLSSLARPCDLEVVTEADAIRHTPQVSVNTDRTFACITNIPTENDHGAAARVGGLGEASMEPLKHGYGVESDLLRLALTTAPEVRLRVLSYGLMRRADPGDPNSSRPVHYYSPDDIPGDVIPALVYCEPVEIISLAWPEDKPDEGPEWRT